MSGSSVTQKPVRSRTKCSSESEESCAEQELNGLEEGEDAMTDEEGEGVEGEGEAGTADWRVREQVQETNLLQEKGKNTKQHTCRFRDWCAHCMMGKRSHSSPRVEEEE